MHIYTFIWKHDCQAALALRCTLSSLWRWHHIFIFYCRYKPRILIADCRTLPSQGTGNKQIKVKIHWVFLNFWKPSEYYTVYKRKFFLDLNKIRKESYKTWWIRNPLGSNHYYDQNFSFLFHLSTSEENNFKGQK